MHIMHMYMHGAHAHPEEGVAPVARGRVAPRQQAERERPKGRALLPGEALELQSDGVEEGRRRVPRARVGPHQARQPMRREVAEALARRGRDGIERRRRGVLGVGERPRDVAELLRAKLARTLLRLRRHPAVERGPLLRADRRVRQALLQLGKRPDAVGDRLPGHVFEPRRRLRKQRREEDLGASMLGRRVRPHEHRQLLRLESRNARRCDRADDVEELRATVVGRRAGPRQVREALRRPAARLVASSAPFLQPELVGRSTRHRRPQRRPRRLIEARRGGAPCYPGQLTLVAVADESYRLRAARVPRAAKRAARLLARLVRARQPAGRVPEGRDVHAVERLSVLVVEPEEVFDTIRAAERARERPCSTGRRSCGAGTGRWRRREPQRCCKEHDSNHHAWTDAEAEKLPELRVGRDRRWWSAPPNNQHSLNVRRAVRVRVNSGPYTTSTSDARR